MCCPAIQGQEKVTSLKRIKRKYRTKIHNGKMLAMPAVVPYARHEALRIIGRTFSLRISSTLAAQSDTGRSSRFIDHPYCALSRYFPFKPLDSILGLEFFAKRKQIFLVLLSSSAMPGQHPLKPFYDSARGSNLTAFA